MARARGVFLRLARLFSGLYYLTREAKTDAQWYFRVVSFLVGAVGWAVVQFLKRGR